MRIEEKQEIVDSCGHLLKTEWFDVETFIEKHIIKFSVKNKHGYKMVLYASSLPELITILKKAKRELEK